MSVLSRSRCRTYSPFLRPDLLSSKSLYHPLRTYAAPPQPRPYSPSKPTTQSPKSKAEVSTKTTVPIPLRSISPTSSTPSRINPPSSTHPPPLNLPSRAPTDPAYKYYFRLGKAYATFYKTGLKSLWSNYRTARTLPNNIWSKSPTAIRDAVKSGSLSRADFQLIRRARSDLNKLPPFLLLWLICGEFTPLVIVFVTGLVPRIIWLPKQFQKAREKAEERRRSCQSDGKFKEGAGAMILRDDLLRLEGSRQREVYKYVSQSLGLHPPILDKNFPFLVLPALVRRRVDRTLSDLEVDDFAIARDGGVRSMDDEEVLRACEERGMDVLEKDRGALREALSGWIEGRSRSSKERKNAD